MRPNIIFIIADDVTPSYHGCYGGPTPTPNLDALAAGGALFRNSRCVSPLCNPSRYSMFTGKFVGRDPAVWQDVPEDQPYHILQNTRVTPETPTLSKRLRESGYHTAHVGKWHSNWETRLGAAEHAGKLGPEHDYFDPDIQRRLKEIYSARLETVIQSTGVHEGGALSWGNIGAANPPKPIRFHNVPWQTDSALDVIERAAANSEPFYLHLANTVPHGPDPAESLGQDHRNTFGGILDHEPKGHPPDETVKERLKAAGLPLDGRLSGINAGMVMLDDQVGAILQKLRDLGIEENTLILYTADHGIAGKGSCYLPGSHVPCLLRWPARIPAGVVVDEPIMHVDFVPTLAEAADLPADDLSCDGLSLLPRLGESRPIERQTTYSEMGWTRSIVKGNFHYIAFRYPPSAIEEMESGQTDVAIDHNARYTSSFGDMNARYRPHYFDADQLYDIAADPYERVNLAAHPDHQNVLNELRHELAEQLKTFDRPFPLEPQEFTQSDQFRELVATRRSRIAPAGPEDHDSELMYALNQRDPEAEYE